LGAKTADLRGVPAATLFDLLNGGDKQWGLLSPYRDFGIAAVDAVA